MNDYTTALETNHLIELEFRESLDRLTFDFRDEYRMIYEGYAWVLYKLHGDKELYIQDFRDKDEFTIFFKVLSRDSLYNF